MTQAKIIGDIHMVETPSAQNKYTLSAQIRFYDKVETAYGFGNDLKECWLDMFTTFNQKYGDVYVTNGKLRGHTVHYSNIRL